MNPERWQEVERIYHAALEQQLADRGTFLVEACAGDEGLRREVASLLAYDDPDGSFIETPPLEALAGALANGPHAETRSQAAGDADSADTPSAGPPPADSLQPGQALRNFKVIRKIGQGGMGEVYEAEDVKLGRRVALKVLPHAANPDTQARHRLLAEARAASRLNHPNIVTVHAVDEAEGRDFIVMEYLDGEPLSATIERGPLSPDQILSYALQAAEAVAAAHAAGIIHRDLKPGNIMVLPGGRVKVLDFGLAKRLEVPDAGDPATWSRITGSGMILGTVPYMSPEQTRGEAIDARSDVFSLGCVLYEAAAGKRPFTGPSALAVMHAIATVEPPPPSTIRTAAPTGLDAILRQALAKDRNQRYVSAGELAEALRKLTFQAADDYPRRSTRRWQTAVLAAIVLLLLATAGGWYYRQEATRNWAREQVPKVEELARVEEYFTAYDLAAKIKSHLPDDPKLARLWPIITDDLSVETEPPGATVFLKRFQRDQSGSFPERQQVGTTPITNLSIARGDYVLYVEKEGYAPFQRTISSALDRVQNAIWDHSAPRRDVGATESASGEVRVHLDATAPIQIKRKLLEAAPERMVFVPGGEYSLTGWGAFTKTQVRLDDYLIDRFEVSNREFKEFVSAGGYSKRQFWKHAFVKDGKEIPWKEAIKLLVDRTGLAGPRSWSGQEYPDGKADHPVTDVTWYEAAAYAEFRGKQLPTVFQWEKAARDGMMTHIHGWVMPWGLLAKPDAGDDRANFKGRGTMAVDSLEFGMSPYGCHHMAGNVSEWCLNSRQLGFTIAGGSWKDPMYLAGGFGPLPGFFASNSLGFRCIRVLPGAKGDQGAAVQEASEAIPELKPVGEKEFEALLSHYRYDKTPLRAEVVDVVETEDWRRERITFAGVGGERALAYLYVPKHAPRPLQVIQYLPSGVTRGGAITAPQEVEVVCGPFIRSGRAVLVVVLKGYSERRGALEPLNAGLTPVRDREEIVAGTIENRRGLDYLATRPEFNMDRVACFGLSVTGDLYIQMAVEPRFKAILLMAAGIFRDHEEDLPEANPVNFIPHIRPAKLLLNGRYDEAQTWEVYAEPLWKLLREPKELHLVEDGHFPPLEKWVPVARKFFDKTLGPVAGQ